MYADAAILSRAQVQQNQSPWTCVCVLQAVRKAMNPKRRAGTTAHFSNSKKATVNQTMVVLAAALIKRRRNNKTMRVR